MWFRKRNKQVAITQSLPIVHSPIYSRNTQIGTLQKVKMAYWSHTGMVRKENEDSFLFIEEILFSYNQPSYFCMAAVADGMGGLSKGQEASAGTMRLLKDLLPQRLSLLQKADHPFTTDDVKEILSASIMEINAALYQDFHDRQIQSGTTISVVVMVDQVCYMTHVGDSRIYLLDPEQSYIRQLTDDHSFVGRLLAIGEMTEEEALNSPRKSEIYKMIAVEPQVVPDIASIQLKPNQYLLLCTDGLTDLVTTAEILQEIKKSRTLEDAVDQLGMLANRRGGYDNCTLILMQPLWYLDD